MLAKLRAISKADRKIIGEAMNAVVPEERDIHGSIGIGYGETLVIGDEDLLTPAAHDALPPGRYACVPASFTVGGRELQCHRFERCLHPRTA